MTSRSLKLFVLAGVAALGLGACSETPEVHGSVSVGVGYSSGYYGGGYYGGPCCYYGGGYPPPVVVVPPGGYPGNGNRPPAAAAAVAADPARPGRCPCRLPRRAGAAAVAGDAEHLASRLSGKRISWAPC